MQNFLVFLYLRAFKFSRSAELSMKKVLQTLGQAALGLYCLTGRAKNE